MIFNGASGELVQHEKLVNEIEKTIRSHLNGDELSPCCCTVLAFSLSSLQFT